MSDKKFTPYQMYLDFQTICGNCGRETILIAPKAGCADPELPTFHFCGCGHPTFGLVQDGVGPVPSFSRVVEEQEVKP